MSRKIGSRPNIRNPKKLALCFLVIKDISNLDVWQKWWAGYEDLISIYAHYSNPEGVTQSILVNNRVPAVPTRWGDISLVVAEGKLYETAIKDKNNAFFALLSGTDIPVRSFEYVYNRLFQDRYRGFLGYRRAGSFREDAKSRSDEGVDGSGDSLFVQSEDCIHLLKKFGLIGSTFVADQWKILSRQNVKDFLRMFDNVEFVKLFTPARINGCIRIVADSLAPDEIMYASFMNWKTGGKLYTQFRYSGPTWVDFKLKSAIHPREYRQITKKLADDLCYANVFFARKFSSSLPRLESQLPVECNKKRSSSRGRRSGSVEKKRRSSK